MRQWNVRPSVSGAWTVICMQGGQVVPNPGTGRRVEEFDTRQDALAHADAWSSLHGGTVEEDPDHTPIIL